jgi:L-iditol 2-dehydrogenase
MKRVVLQKGRAWLEDVPDPTPEGEWVVVRVRVSPICGSDRKAFLSDQPVRTAGHEGTGEVAAVAGSSRVRVGDRVLINPLSGCGRCRECRTGNYILCRGKPPWETHFAEYVRVQDFVLSPLPDDISFRRGALAGCAFSPAFSAQKRMAVGPGDTLLVTGLGPVGLGAVVIGKARGARVLGVDVEPYRRELATRLGADAALDGRDSRIGDLVAAAAAPGVVTRALDASGNAAAQRLCLDAVAPRGQVAWIGQNRESFAVNPSLDFINKSLTLIGAWHFDLNDWDEMAALLRRTPAAEALITHEYPLADVQQAFDVFVSGQAGKVFLLP